METSLIASSKAFDAPNVGVASSAISIAVMPSDQMSVEAPYALAEAITDADPEACVVVDCVSLWVAHALMANETLSVESLDLRLDAVVAAASGRLQAMRPPLHLQAAPAAAEQPRPQRVERGGLSD